MVFESVVADLLNRFLGDYVQNFDSSQLKLGIWGGDVSLKHLDVKESALDELELPVRVISGHLGSLILKIPWKNMYTAPVIATIQGLYVVVSPNLAVKYDAEKEEKAAQEAKQAELQRIEDEKQKSAQKKETKPEKKDTFTEKLVTQIIKNLQVKIIDIHIRYEDIVSDPRNPFSFGFTLHNLSFETTNEKWIPAIIQENVSVIHKLVTLDSLSLYWNSNTVLYSKMNPDDRQDLLQKSIATSTYRPPDVAYMLGPINSTAQLRLNSKPESDDFKIPKVWLNVVMQEIAVGLSKRQYRDLMKMLEAFDRMTVATLYRKYRPDAPHSGHAKEWWNFAISAILEEDVRRKRRNWSWQHMKDHRELCKEYKDLYVMKLCGKKMSADKQKELTECESKLDLFNITVARKQAELEHSRKVKAGEMKPKSWGSWFGGWFSYGASAQSKEDSAGQKIVKQFEEAMTEEEKAKLYEAIGYHEHIAPAEYPKEFVENQLAFLLHNLTLILSDDTVSVPQVLNATLKEVSTHVEQRPSADALMVRTKAESFIVNGVPSKSKKIPTIASSQDTESSNLPLIDILYEMNPLDGSCDNRVHIHAQPLQIIYDALTVNRLVEVFSPPEQIDLQQIQATAMLKLEEMKEMSAFGLQYAIEQHKYLDLKVDMKPAFIIIPQNGKYEENTSLIVINLGNFKMESFPRDPQSPTVRSMVKAGSTEDEVLTTMISSAYDKFHIGVESAEIILAAPGDDWRSAVGSHSSDLHLLYPVSLQIDLHKSIVSVDPRMPKVKVSGELPLLDLNISDYQLFDVLKIGTSIPLPDTGGPPTPQESFKTKNKEPAAAVDISTVNAKVLQQAKKEAVQTFSMSSSESDEKETLAEPSPAVQSTELELKFEVKQFEVSLSHHIGASTVRTLKFAFHDFGTTVTMRTFEMSAELYLGGILLDYRYNVCDSPIKIVSSTINDMQEDLFFLKYLQADKRAPDFSTAYNSTLQFVSIKCRDINFILHQEAILSIMDFSNTLSVKLTEYTGSSEDTVSRTTLPETPQNRKSFKDNSEKLLKPAPVAIKRKKKSSIILMEVQASLDAVTALICSSAYDLTDIKIKGMNASVVMDRAKTSVTASLKDIVVANPNPLTVYPKMIITESGEVLDLKLDMYNDATNDENYIDLSAVDMSVSVSFGRMRIVFLNRFVASLLEFLDHFQTAKDKVAEASAVAAERAKVGMEQVYEKATRILLDVCIQAPVVIVPQNSASKNSVVADLGVLKLSNKFAFGKKRNELGIPAILDQLVLNMENLKLSRALVQPSSIDIVAECLLLEPVSFSVAVVRNLASGWYTDQPEVDVYGQLAAVKVTMSQEDYTTVMSILSENLAESPSDEGTRRPSQVTTATTVSAVQHEESATKEKEKVTYKAEDIIPRKVYTRFKLAFEMNSLAANFYTGSTELTSSSNQRDSTNSMASVVVSQIVINAEMFSNEEMTAKVHLLDFVLDDTRIFRTKGVTRLMERTVKDESEKMINVSFKQNAKGEMTVDVRVCRMTLVACLPYIMKLAEFFSQVQSTDSKTAPQNPSAKPAVTQRTGQPAVDSKPGTTMTVSVIVEQPDIVLMEDIEDVDSSAVFLNNKISAKLTMSDTVMVISGKITDLTFYTACFNPSKRMATMIRILNPSDIDLQCNMQKESQHIDLLFKDLVLQISPGTVEILMNILSTMTTEQGKEEEKEEKPVVDHSDLWKVKPLQTCNFWFLETLSGSEKGIEASEYFVDQSENMFIPNEQALQIGKKRDDSSQQVAAALQPSTATQVPVEEYSSISSKTLRKHNAELLFTVRKVIVTVEAGVGSRTVPLLLLESSFQAQICDWSTDLNVESSLSIEVSYYNEKIAVWEPLLEPVETEKGHRSWELFMEMSRKTDIEPQADDDSEPPPVPMRFEIRSDDVMELTLSKKCLEVLTNLGEAFGEAVKHVTVREDKLPFAPYRVYNDLGIPVTIVLNGKFQVLNMAEDYGSVILESGSPPLHLTEELAKVATRSRYSVLRKQFVKDDVMFNIKIETKEMHIARLISVACTDKRYFQLPKRTYPGDKWGFIVDIKSLYGCKVITFHSALQVHNHFQIPIDVYYMMSTVSEVRWCGTVEPGKTLHLPLDAVYTATSELFFRPKNMAQSYTLSLEAFVWKVLTENPSASKVVHCKCKDSKEHSFFINISGAVERVFFEETAKKTVGSSLYKINLHPTVRFRNLLVYPISYSLLGLDKDFALPEGETNELWSAEIGKTVLEIRLNDYLEKNWSCCKTIEADVDELSVWTFIAQLPDKALTLELGMHTRNIGGSIVMELYSPYCMINKTGLLLTYRRSKKVEKSGGKERKDDEGNIIYHPPEMDQPVLFSFKAKAFFSKKKAALKVLDSEWSDKFSIDAVGSSGNVVAKTKDGRNYGIGVQIRLSQSSLTKMIIFTPFYILVNNCDTDIEVQEVAESLDWIPVKKSECVPFWPADAKSAQMVVRYSGDRVQSEAFSFKEDLHILLKLNSSKGGIHVDCQVAQSSIILTFEDYTPGHAAALIVNHMSEYSVKFKQSGCKDEVVLHPYSCILYSWSDPMAKRLLCWTCGEKEGTDNLVKDDVGEFQPEADVRAYWLSFLDGMQRVLVFTHNLNRAFAIQAAVQAVRMDQEFLIMLQGVGLSLIDNEKKAEVMYMGITSTGIIWEGKKEKSSRFKPLSWRECIILENAYQRYQNEMKIGKRPHAVQSLESKIEVNFKDMKMLKPSLRDLKRHFQTGLWLEYKASPGVMSLHAKINRLQIDNQLIDCVFPVVLAPVPPPKSVAAETAPKPFAELSIMLKKEEKSTVQQIKYCKMLIQEFHVKLDQGFINSIISFFTPEQPAEINYVKIISLDKELIDSQLKDVAAIYSSQEQKCYFDNLHFSPLKMHISFSMTGGGAKEENKPTPIHSDFLNLLLQSVGVTLTEVQDVIFKLDYFERKFVFMSLNQLTNEAISHYTSQAVKQLYMLVLGLDVIGNPVGLILGLGEGVTDLFYEPIQGAIQGPEEFIEGLGLGVKSLFGHAIGGAAGAASRITGTLGKGLAALTLDEDYQKRRRQNLNPHTHDAKQRLAQSGKGLVMGVFDGVTGVVRKPIEGAREEGVGGFFKGVGKGLIGVVTRPTAGAVDFVSGSFDSVKRMADLQDEVKRLRAPRYIRSDGVIRPYVKKESIGSRLLQEVEKGKYASTDVYEAHIPVGVDDKSCLVVTNNRIMYISKGDILGQWNTEWEYRWQELKGIPELVENGIKIMLKVMRLVMYAIYRKLSSAGSVFRPVSDLISDTSSNTQRSRSHLKEPHKKKMNIFGPKVAGKLVHASDQQQCQWIVSKIAEAMKSKM